MVVKCCHLLYGEHKLLVSENKLLRKMFGPKRDEIETATL